MAEGSMKVMKHKWCWIGLVICASSTAFAAKKGDDKSDTKKESASESDKKGDASKDDAAKDDAAKDDATKDDSGDEDVAPAPPPKKAAKKVKAEGAPSKRSSTLNMGLLGSLGASPFTRLGIGLRGGLTLGQTEGLYVGVIGTYFAGTSVSEPRLYSPPNAEKTRNAIVVGGEVGYDVLAATDFLVRPYLSLGIAYKSDKTCATGECTTDNGVQPTLAPGLQAIYTMGAIYLGGDLRYQIILNTSDASAAVFSLTTGLRI
jgi:hypothetical protein